MVGSFIDLVKAIEDIYPLYATKGSGHNDIIL